MKNTSQLSSASAQIASRSKGSMFFSIFGGAWLIGWYLQANIASHY